VSGADMSTSTLFWNFDVRVLGHLQAGDAECDLRALHHLPAANDAFTVGVGRQQAVPERRGEARGLVSQPCVWP